MVDNEYVYVATPSVYRSRLTFDKSPQVRGLASYAVTYETAIFELATPVDRPLSPLFTSLDEGFLYIGFDEYSLDHIELRLSPSKVVADGSDYLLITLRSLDRYGNPKPYQTFTLSTSFGTLNKYAVTTDRDGLGVVTLTAAPWTTSRTGTVTVTGAAASSIGFDIGLLATPNYRLMAAVSSEQIPADGVSQNMVYGKVQNVSYNPVPYARINWRRARSIYELFLPTVPVAQQSSGTVTADSAGGFIIGPFTAATPGRTGYWFLSADSNSASPSTVFTKVGDVVAWHEYPDSTYGVHDYTGLPQQAMQLATPINSIPPYSYVNQFPANYDETQPYATATPMTGRGIWRPPYWFAVPRYRQYQLGWVTAVAGTIAIPYSGNDFRKQL